MALVNEEVPFIFIHIYRTGGTSIHRTLSANFPNSRQFYDCHCSALHLKQWFEEQGRQDFWNRAFKFAIVRNPYDWQVSVYEFTRHSGGKYTQEIQRKNFRGYLSWYRRKMALGPLHGRGNNYFYTQSQAIQDEQGHPLVDFVGHFEQLPRAWERIRQELGLTIPLPHLNASPRKSWQIYYTRSLRRTVQRMFSADFTNFHYPL